MPTSEEYNEKWRAAIPLPYYGPIFKTCYIHTCRKKFLTLTRYQNHYRKVHVEQSQ